MTSNRRWTDARQVVQRAERIVTRAATDIDPALMDAATRAIANGPDHADGAWTTNASAAWRPVPMVSWWAPPTRSSTAIRS
jgi:hypothetical protein